MRKNIGTIDLDTGELLENPPILVIKPQKNGFEEGRKMMMSQDAMLEIASIKSLTGDDKSVLFALLGFLDYQNQILISQVRLAERIGLRQNHISRSLKKLVKLEIIYECEKIGRNRTYKLSPNIGWKGNGKNHKKALSDHLQLVINNSD